MTSVRVERVIRANDRERESKTEVLVLAVRSKDEHKGWHDMAWHQTGKADGCRRGPWERTGSKTFVHRDPIRSDFTSQLGLVPDVWGGCSSETLLQAHAHCYNRPKRPALVLADL